MHMSEGEMSIIELGRRLFAIAVVVVALSFIGLQVCVFLRIGNIVSEFFWYALMLSTVVGVCIAPLAIVECVAEFLGKRPR